MKIKADRLRIENRVISPLTFTVLSDDKVPDVVRITDLKGRCYGGRVNGKVVVNLGKVVSYQSEMEIRDVPLAPFGSPEKDKKWMAVYLKAGSRPDADAATGRITANLKIRGNTDDASSKWGAGQFKIHDARIYELPIAMVAMHLVNLSLPTSKSFDTVQGGYVIRGDDVKLNKLELKCKTLEIRGDGMLDYPTRNVDLLLFTRNPTGTNIPLVTDILSTFKNTLISIHVTGPLADPKANILQLRGALRTWQDVIKNSPKKRR
jgi:hypothetical protein